MYKPRVANASSCSTATTPGANFTKKQAGSVRAGTIMVFQVH